MPYQVCFKRFFRTLLGVVGYKSVRHSGGECKSMTGELNVLIGKV